MTTPVARPGFYEGEVLPAADLTAIVDYARAQSSRHSRYEHSWGIVTGLDLTISATSTAGGQSYKVVTVSPGLAIDGTGREIVVPDPVQLTSTDFLNQVVPQPDPTLLYPIFLVGLDQPAPASSSLTGACNTAQPTRMQETSNVMFGAPGSELAVDGQTAPALTDGPDDGVSSSWKILLGFVTWDGSATPNQFKDIADTDATSIGRRYVGVNAAQVVSGSGSLLLATHPAGFTGPNSIMAVGIQEAKNDGQLVFGKLNADGSIVPVLTVKSTGDVIATGQISGAVKPGSVQVQSGIAFDGMALPLPPGINAADVNAGKVTIHVHVSPRMDLLQTPSAWFFTYECFADTLTRQVHCRVQQWDMTTAPATPKSVLPSHCDYTVIAAVAAS